MSSFSYHPNPAKDYDEAVLRIQSLLEKDGPEVGPESRTCFMTQGQKVKQAIVLLHGYTNSPKCFLGLGSMFHQLGYNVLIPREPHHGLRDRMTTAHGEITARGLVTFLNESIDIAQGLGEQVNIAGLSMGGVLAAWAAQQRADVNRVGIISPALGFLAATSLTARLALLLPNRFIWWDEEIQDAPHPPFHSYPRYSTRTLANILYLGRKLQTQARRTPPSANQVVMIINPCDPSVDNSAAKRLVASWKAAGAQNIITYAFDKKYKLIHDLISPDQPEQKIDIVYPILLDLLA